MRGRWKRPARPPARPLVPRYPGQELFRGRQLHPLDSRDAAAFAGQHVVVVGGGPSAVQLLGEISQVASTTWVTRRPPVWREGLRRGGRPESGSPSSRRPVCEGCRPGSVVGVTGLLLSTPYIRDAHDHGVLERLPTFDRITEAASSGRTAGSSAPTPSCGPPGSGPYWATWPRCTCAVRTAGSAWTARTSSVNHAGTWWAVLLGGHGSRGRADRTAPDPGPAGQRRRPRRARGVDLRRRSRRHRPALRQGLARGRCRAGARHRLYQGATGIAGEIGHTQIDAAGDQCRCGQRGCLEAMISASVVRRRLQVSGFEVAESAWGLDEVVRDPVGARVITEAGRHLGRVVADICNCLNPARGARRPARRCGRAVRRGGPRIGHALCAARGLGRRRHPAGGTGSARGAHGHRGARDAAGGRLDGRSLTAPRSRASGTVQGLFRASPDVPEGVLPPGSTA